MNSDTQRVAPHIAAPHTVAHIAQRVAPRIVAQQVAPRIAQRVAPHIAQRVAHIHPEQHD